MRITTCTTHPDDALEEYRPAEGFESWELVISGFWSSSPFHSGHIAYFVANPKQGLWVLDAVERNAILDDVTEEDVEDGRLNDDQIQAMWGKSLEEAKKQTFRRIVAVCQDSPLEATALEMATVLYDAIKMEVRKIVDESDRIGLLE